MASKSAQHSALNGVTSLVYSIEDLDRLPLIRRRQRKSAPLKSCLLASAAILVFLLMVIVVYLVISLCLVQRQLTNVNRELTSVSFRLDNVEKQLHSKQKEDDTLPEEAADSRSENATASNPLTTSKGFPYERGHRKHHRIGKREVSSRSYRESRAQRSSRSTGKKGKSDRRDRQLRLVWKNIKDVQNEMQKLRNDVAHPSALLVPSDNSRRTSNEDSSSNYDNAMQWVVEQNNLFDTRDSSNLVVKTAGYYFIYLQITYNGRRSRANPTCSHIVELENPYYESRNKTLLYGSSTQHNLGQVYIYKPNGHEVRAIDTLHLSGVFGLTVGDRIYVKPDDYSHDCIVSDFKDKTFFGAFRLQSTFQE